jgi:4-diphosphocytidyl-2-C-methyl-D-erythritol kinase
MSGLQETAYAKLNLALHVRRRRDDDYHELETLFAFVDDGDRISGELADDISLSVSGPFGNGLSNSDNLVVRAAKLIKAHYHIQKGVAFHLEKRLPVASGIGGGSADAAAAARLLYRLWNIHLDAAELEMLLAPLGADIPACVRSHTVYGEGTGTVLRAVTGKSISGRSVLLVNPLQPVATGPVFKAWDAMDRGELDFSDPWEATLRGRNDLQQPAVSICPAIGDVLDVLMQTEADLVRMSGSGATCFALYNSDVARDIAHRAVASTCPQWWTMASSLR